MTTLSSFTTSSSHQPRRKTSLRKRDLYIYDMMRLQQRHHESQGGFFEEDGWLITSNRGVLANGVVVIEVRIKDYGSIKWKDRVFE
ncbi:hypothetical protein PIB30_060119 [Stylosanthes scabra]|uniref:Uncharacterized protein n=1 Tax=Stylosanthes scabra TaxID=79078 RepID=A0ABU6WIQ8_9FABA|nr:hypothetical protein [Stylosanthes scabra]